MTDGGEVNLETGFPYETVRALMRKGHRIVFADGPYGGYQAIMRDPETGFITGFGEPQGWAGGGVLRFPGHRAEPLCGGGFRSGIACWAGWVGCWGTPQYVLVGLAAASMRLTPPASPPTRPLTVSVAATAGRKRRSKAKQQQQPRCGLGSDPFSAGKRIRPFLFSDTPLPRKAWKTNRHRKLSGVGRCGWAGPLAPWMAPSSPHGWVHGVSCPPTPPHPTSSNPEPL
jgi:hypothetical protein